MLKKTALFSHVGFPYHTSPDTLICHLLRKIRLRFLPKKLNFQNADFFPKKKQIMQSKPLPTILYYILYGQPLMNIVEYCRCSIHTFSLWNYFVRKIPNHDCCCLTFEIRSIVHLDCFSKYDFNWQSMVYKEKFWLLVIECDLPITIHPNFLFFIFPLFRDICSCFREIFCDLGECWLERIFLDTKVKLLKVPKTSKYTKIVQGWQFGHWKAMLDWWHCQRHNGPEGWVIFPK